MNRTREQLLDRLIRVYGFEHEIVIEFARMCESNNYTDKDLTVIVECHEQCPQWEDDEEQAAACSQWRVRDWPAAVFTNDLICQAFF